jgi:hypothetical protein
MRNRILFFTGILSLFALLLTETSFGQKRRRKKEVKVVSIYDIDTLSRTIPIQRRMWHDKIDRAQRGADAFDGRKDSIIYYGEDERITGILTNALLKDVDHLQIMIENLPAPERGEEAQAAAQVKILYLRALEKLVQRFNLDSKVDPIFYMRLVANFRELIIARQENRVMDFVRDNVNVYTLANEMLLDGYPEEKAYLFREMGHKDPVMMIQRLNEFADQPYADDIISEAAKVVPGMIYNYASSSNYRLSNAIRRTKDPLVQTIVLIERQSKAPLKAMAFLSDIHNKRKTIAEIDVITANQDLFFKNLVRLKLENEAMGGATYTDELQYRGLKYVRDMNDLHESPDPVRFKGIDRMGPEELYFLIVYGQDEIYTSSFLGTFKRMLERMDSTKGDQLLEKVHYDKFRTFLRMCAGYNTLGRFLATMDADKKTVLMRDFIAGLDKGREDDLEDAVDVADAFGSINDAELVTFLRKEVRDNYEHSYKIRSMKGMRIYALLATLFDGLKASENEEALKQQSEVLNLPPINMVRFNSLVNDSGVVYMQFFFYGDEDGKNSYNSFLGNFKDGKWKVVTSKYWATITSTAGKPIVIYANLPLEEPQDEEAQRQLQTFLDEKLIKPTIIVHRGHSYHLSETLEHLTKSTRIVMLGSCGGYHNLGTVLDRSPDAHIISSKQTGAMNVNEPIIKAIDNRLLEGKDVNWVSMWKDLEVYFNTKGALKETFDDYVPPHKNLGAIFIKAYRKLSNADASKDEAEAE